MGAGKEDKKDGKREELTKGIVYLPAMGKKDL